MTRKVRAMQPSSFFKTEYDPNAKVGSTVNQTVPPTFGTTAEIP